MKVRTLVAALAMSCWLVGAPAMAQKDSQPDKKAPAKPADKGTPKGPSEDELKMMAAMEAAGKPGAAHERLAQLAGQWDAKVKWKMGPDAPWTESVGSSSNQMWYDGRFLHQNFSADLEGQPFKGMAVVGYNNMTKEYESTWIDSMSTGIMVMTGKSDAAGKTLTFMGESADPMQGGKKKMREVTTINSADKHTSEFFEHGPNGKEYSSMVIVYTRKAGGDSDKSKPEKSKDKDHN